MSATDAVGGTDRRTDAEGREAGLDISVRVILAAVAGGLAGLAAMVPVLLGLPALLGLFRAEPLLSVAELGMVVGLAPNLALGIGVFVAGGAVALPLLFVVAGAFLPPREPRWARGVVFATVMWTGFVIAFWPGVQAAVLFLALSLGAHWVYGLVLGRVVGWLAYVPQHAI